jgi:ABC-type polysaccharide/polyol phosphate export permease
LSTLKDEFEELWRCRRLIVVLASRQLSLRYKNSAIGVAWSLLIPLVQAGAMAVAVEYIMSAGPQNMGSYILCAYLPWTFFQSAIMDGSSAVLMYQDLLKKVYLPREALPISAVLANLVHFAMAFVVFLIFRYGFMSCMYGWPGLPPASVFMLPVVLIILTAYTMGVTFILCAWTTFYEDVKYLVSTTTQLLFYVVPIIYFAEKIDSSTTLPHAHLLYRLYLANPLAWIVTAFKQMFFGVCLLSAKGDPHIIKSAPFNYKYCALHAVISFTILIGGYAYFNHMKWKFTERP